MWNAIACLLLLFAACQSTAAQNAPWKGDDERDASLDLVFYDAARDRGASLEHLTGVYENASYVPVIELIDAAQRALDLEIYEMHDEQVLRALIRAVARGVRVRVVQEPAALGSSCGVFDEAESSRACTLEKALRDDVRAHGGRYVAFAKQAFCSQTTCFQHGKMMVVDATVALISTGNFNPSSFCRDLASACSRDYTAITDRHDVVSGLTRVFEADLAEAPNALQTALDETLRSALTVSPAAKPQLLDFIRGAERSIRLTTPYLHDPDVNDLLRAKAKAGVDVLVTIESFCGFSRPTAALLARERATFSSFDAAGVKTRAFNSSQQIAGKPAYLHAKVVVIDEQKAWLGSINGSLQATTINREFGLFLDDPGAVAKLDAWLRLDHEDPRSESWTESLACAKDEPLAIRD